MRNFLSSSARASWADGSRAGCGEGEGARGTVAGAAAAVSVSLCAFLILMTAVFKRSDFRRVRIMSFSAARAARAAEAAAGEMADSGLYIDDEEDDDDDDGGEVRVKEKAPETAVRGVDTLLLLLVIIVVVVVVVDFTGVLVGTTSAERLLSDGFDGPVSEPCGGDTEP